MARAYRFRADDGRPVAHPRQVLGLALLLWLLAMLLLAGGQAAGASPDTAHAVADGLHEVSHLLPPPFGSLLSIFAALTSAAVAIFARKQHRRIRRLENGDPPTKKAPRP